jgi:endonuclease/exonuclease/phosphatase family metal-dependent hydrolase
MVTFRLEKSLSPRFLFAMIFLLGMVFLFSCAEASSFRLKPEEREAYAPQNSPLEVRILTINIWSGLTYRGIFKMGRYPDNPKRRYDLLVTEIRKLAPDIIVIQEANPLPRYAERLAADLDHRVIFGVALGGIRFGSFGIPINLREGDAILVKKPWTIEEFGRKRLGGWGIVANWFCFHFGEITQALLGRAVVNAKPLYIYGIHLHAGPFHGSAFDTAVERLSRDLSHEKAEEAKKTAEKDIERRKREIANLMMFVEKTLPAGMPAVILGDFNTTAESGELDPLLGDGKWVDTFRLKNPYDEGPTWDPSNNPNFRQKSVAPKPYDILNAHHDHHSYRIDFILVSGNIPRDRILGSRVVLTPEDGFSVSDHYGVLTTLKW